ncbi:MAG: hypothetical protein KF799_02130 [Bdellovibrionales bacterium]|nr:hypothetical protein [Bdellovibrionales bacterium]
MSTLRRRIKAGEIEYKFIDGKYLLKDGPLFVGQPATETIAPPTSVKSHAQAPAQEKTVAAPAASAPATAPLNAEPDQHDQFWKTTQGLLNEIKKAYSLILQEKEEQILQLKEEVADLKTLVRVLEDDNTRLKNKPSSGLVDFDLGLEA